MRTRSAIGRRIRALREEQGLTQEKLAYETGRTKSYLSEIEAGRKTPSVQVLGELAERLGVKAFDLLADPAAGPRERLIDLTRHLTPAAVERMVADAIGADK